MNSLEDLTTLCNRVSLTNRERMIAKRIYEDTLSKYVKNYISYSMTGSQCQTAWETAKEQAYANARLYIKKTIDEWQKQPDGLIDRIIKYLSVE